MVVFLSPWKVQPRLSGLGGPAVFCAAPLSYNLSIEPMDQYARLRAGQRHE